MKNELWKRAGEVFAQAISLPPSKRPAYLESICGDDVELKSEVESMLSEDAAATVDGFLSPVLAQSKRITADRGTQVRVDAMLGRSLGPYRIERLIGHGGMGNVYLATRIGEFESQVAIKLIRRGTDSQTVVDRFKNEIQFQAALGKHSNIAGILDAGETDDGLPYFVMDYVDGTRIDDYCDKQRLELRGRLELFADVCAAVQFAHQNTVIHRDLKPSNILVTTNGRPILIDFGIAKLLDDRSDDGETDQRDDLTQTGAQVFTPSYASPEQVRGETLSTSSDVYSLGAVLYELLTGRSPYQGDTSSVSEMVEMVLHQEPTRPSEAVSRSNTVAIGDSETHVQSVAARCSCRGTTPRRLQQRLQGDLDQIVLMALRKDATRRYQSSREFEDDVRKFLAGMPVSARPDSTAYRVSKFIKRNKVAVGIATLTLASLIAGVVGTSFGLLRANAEWNRAEANLVLANKNAIRAERHASRANANADRANEQQLLAEQNAREAQRVVRDFYMKVSEQQMFDTPMLQPMRRQFLESAFAFYDQVHTENPDDHFVAEQLGDLSFRLGIARDALGDAEAAMSANELAISILEQSTKRLEAEQAADPTATTQKDVEHVDFLNRTLARAYTMKAYFVMRQGNARGAFEWFEKSETILNDIVNRNPDDLDARRSLAEILSGIGAHWESSPMPERGRDFHERALILRKELTACEGVTEYDKHDLARAFWNAGYAKRLEAGNAIGELRSELLNQAMSDYVEAIAILQPLTEQNPLSMSFRMTLAELHDAIGFLYYYRNRRGMNSPSESRENNKLALAEYLKSLALQQRLSEQNPGIEKLEHQLSNSYMNVGIQQKLLGRIDESIASYQQAVEIRRRLLGANEKDIRLKSGLASLLNNLGLAYLERENGHVQALKQFQEAERYHREIVATEPNVPRYRSLLANHILNLAIAHKHAGDFAEAAALIQQAKTESPGDPEQLLIIARNQAILAQSVRESKPDDLKGYIDATMETIDELVAGSLITKSELEQSVFDIVRDTPGFPLNTSTE